MDTTPEKINAEIAKLMAETGKINAETRWYVPALFMAGASALTLALTAIVKLFL